MESQLGSNCNHPGKRKWWHGMRMAPLEVERINFGSNFEGKDQTIP